MGTAIRHQNDFWPEHQSAQLHIVARSSSSSWLWNLFFGVTTETRIGSLLAGGGLIMAVKSGTEHISNLARLTFPPGPLEICALGLLIWLHAKWRHASRI